MRSNVQLIRKKIEYLLRMRNYLDYSYEQILRIVPVKDFDALMPEQHEALAAFRVRFSEFQEHLGKLMRAVAREEEQETEPFSFVLLYMEKIGILDSAMRWKMIRELRNAINHEYEEDGGRLSEFFEALTTVVPELYEWLDRLIAFCQSTYSFSE